eukprot:4642258-Pleurochrysis_carterae.AAC.2
MPQDRGDGRPMRLRPRAQAFRTAVYSFPLTVGAHCSDAARWPMWSTVEMERYHPRRTALYHKWECDADIFFHLKSQGLPTPTAYFLSDHSNMTKLQSVLTNMASAFICPMYIPTFSSMSCRNSRMLDRISLRCARLSLRTSTFVGAYAMASRATRRVLSASATKLLTMATWSSFLVPG